MKLRLGFRRVVTPDGKTLTRRRHLWAYVEFRSPWHHLYRRCYYADTSGQWYGATILPASCLVEAPR